MPARLRIEMTATADQKLEAIRRRSLPAALQLEREMWDLGDDPRPSCSSAMRGVPGVRCVRWGGHRVLCYTIERDVVLVLDLPLHARYDVYPQIRRLLGR